VVHLPRLTSSGSATRSRRASRGRRSSRRRRPPARPPARRHPSDGRTTGAVPERQRGGPVTGLAAASRTWASPDSRQRPRDRPPHQPCRADHLRRQRCGRRRTAATSSTRSTRSRTHADPRDPASVLNAPTIAATLDLTRPVAVLMLAVLHFVPIDDLAWASGRTAGDGSRQRRRRLPWQRRLDDPDLVDRVRAGQKVDARSAPTHPRAQATRPPHCSRARSERCPDDPGVARTASQDPGRAPVRLGRADRRAVPVDEHRRLSNCATTVVGGVRRVSVCGWGRSRRAARTRVARPVCGSATGRGGPGDDAFGKEGSGCRSSWVRRRPNV